MTPDERTLLSTFLRDLDARPGVTKDPEAAELIDRAVSQNRDAAYLLVQHAIVSDRALHAAQARIDELEEQLRRDEQPVPSSQGSFLSSFAGPWGQSAPAAQPGQGQPGQGQPGQGQPVQSQPSAFSGGGGLGSFMRQAGTTAAGVAGGEFLFSGLSNMFGGGRHEGFGGGQGFLGGGGNEPENVTINNYGDDDNGGQGFLGGGDLGGNDDQ